MNKGARGKKNGHAGRGGVERCWPRTSRASFNRQERAIERHLRQGSKKMIQEQMTEKRTSEEEPTFLTCRAPIDTPDGQVICLVLYPENSSAKELARNTKEGSSHTIQSVEERNEQCSG